MKKIALKVPELAFIVVTRAALGFGAGLLVSARIPESRRRKIGMTLVAIGATSTIPALITIRRNMTA
jgi:hypothetical protein